MSYLEYPFQTAKDAFLHQLMKEKTRGFFLLQKCVIFFKKIESSGIKNVQILLGPILGN